MVRMRSRVQLPMVAPWKNFKKSPRNFSGIFLFCKMINNFWEYFLSEFYRPVFPYLYHLADMIYIAHDSINRRKNTKKSYKNESKKHSNNYTEHNCNPKKNSNGIHSEKDYKLMIDTYPINCVRFPRASRISLTPSSFFRNSHFL